MSFSKLIGHERPLRILRGLIGTGRIPTTYLFSGQKGIGKHLAAVEFAKALNCERREGDDACDRCRACVRIDALSHSDLRLIAPDDGVIKVEQVRELEEFLSLKPLEGVKKTVIVDDAELMNVFSANAFLKTLEEPPGDSIIILVSSRSEMLLDTIRSRCLHIRFLPLPLDALREVSRALGMGGADEVQLRLAMGSVGSLVNGETVERRNHAFAIFRDMLSGGGSMLPKEREELEEALDYFLLFLRDCIASRVEGVGPVVFNNDLAGELARISRGLTAEDVIGTYALVRDLRQGTAHNLNRSILANYVAAVLSSLGQPAPGRS